MILRAKACGINRECGKGCRKTYVGRLIKAIDGQEHKHRLVLLFTDRILANKYNLVKCVRSRFKILVMQL